jgi:hypothetical protein
MEKRRVHKTLLGRVIYDRKRHGFSGRDVARILKKHIIWQESSVGTGNAVDIWQMTQLFLFLFDQHFLPGYLSAHWVRVDTAPTWYEPVKTALNMLASTMGVPSWVIAATAEVSNYIYPHMKDELVLYWGPVLASFWAASEVERRKSSFR